MWSILPKENALSRRETSPASTCVQRKRRKPSKSRLADDKKKKKVQKKEAPTKNYVHWDEKTFQRLIEQREETLPSQFAVSHGMIITLLLGTAPNYNLGYHRLVDLIARCHETKAS